MRNTPQIESGNAGDRVRMRAGGLVRFGGVQQGRAAGAAIRKRLQVAQAKAAPAPATNQYVSTFEDLQAPQARDPFFPDSHRREPAPVAVATETHKTSVAGESASERGIVGSQTPQNLL